MFCPFSSLQILVLFPQFTSYLLLSFILMLSLLLFLKFPTSLAVRVNSIQRSFSKFKIVKVLKGFTLDPLNWLIDIIFDNRNKYKLKNEWRKKIIIEMKNLN